MAGRRLEPPPGRQAGAAAGRTRLLLVEDDPSIRRFVGMALEDLALDVVEAGTLAEARLALAQGEFALLLTDLMLPDGHGLSLLNPAQAPRTGHRVIVFSAGISPAARQQALARGAWRVLDKPVPLGVLSACVRDALADAAAQRGAPGPGAPSSRPPSGEGTAPPPLSNSPAGSRRKAAIEMHFAGHTALFDGFMAASLLQFPADIAAGDAALAHGDPAALHRLAHSLKTVLQLLGDDSACALARGLEAAAASGGTTATMAPLWDALRQAVLAQR